MKLVLVNCVAVQFSQLKVQLRELEFYWLYYACVCVCVCWESPAFDTVSVEKSVDFDKDLGYGYICG